jgi:hypothetical protein
MDIALPAEIAVTSAPSPAPLPLVILPEPVRLDLGRAVQGGVIRFLSVSQIGAYDPNQEGGCPRRWAYTKLFGKKEESTEAQEKGKLFARQLEHYLKTGSDALSPELRVGKHLLPQPGPDLEVERELGDAEKAVALCDLLHTITLPSKQVASVTEEIEVAARLTAAGIPLTGAPDVRHRRGEYVDRTGAVRREDAPDKTVEVIDHKSTSQVYDRTAKDGKIWPGYAKTIEQVMAATQMIGYAVASANTYPDIELVRLSHIYYQTKRGLAADKRTGILTVEEARRRWSPINAIGREMSDVAKAKRPEDVPANSRSCRAFNKDCPHATYCERPQTSVFDLLDTHTYGKPTGAGGSMGQGLFGESVSGNRNGSAAPLPAAGLFGAGAGAPVAAVVSLAASPVLSDAEHAAATEAAKYKILAEEAATTSTVPSAPSTTPPVSSYGFCSKCGTGMSPLNASMLPDGETVKHIGCPAVPKIQSTAIGAINPPDAPPHDPVAAAVPLSAEVIAGIEDPQIKARAELHAREHTAREAAKATDAAAVAGPAPVKTSGRCAAGGTRIEISAAVAFERKMNCLVCGKELKLKPAKEGEKGLERFFVTLSGHNMLEATSPPPSIPLAPASATTSTTVSIPPAISAPAPAAPPIIPSIPRIVPAVMVPVPVPAPVAIVPVAGESDVVRAAHIIANALHEVSVALRERREGREQR